MQFSFDLQVKEGQKGELRDMLSFDATTCQTTQFNNTVIETFLYPDQSVVTGDGYELVPAMAELFLLNVTNDEYFGTLYVPLTEYTASIEFCVDAGIGSSIGSGGNAGDNGTIAINFTFLQFSMEVMMNQGFTTDGDDNTGSGENGIAWVAVDESTSGVSSTSNFTVGLDNLYDMSACECDVSNNNQCIANPLPKPQNSLITICVTTNSEEVAIREFKSLQLKQGAYIILAINNYVQNDITFTGNLGQKTAIIGTRLPSIFYESPSPVTVSGVAVFEFSSGSQRRRGLYSLRNLQDQTGEGTFGVDIEVDLDAAPVESEAKRDYYRVGSLANLFIIIISATLLDV